MVEITNCIIRNNSAASDWEPNGGIGGGVYIHTNRKIRIDKCQITNNFAEERGGGYTSMEVQIHSSILLK